MSEFQLYFSLGYDHILDLQGYDHILFVLALGIMYQFKNWKQLLILITAFTIGHSITLFLSAFNLVVFNSSLIEFLIPITIILTAISNIFTSEDNLQAPFRVSMSYFFTTFFGLIHGLGFSNYLKSLLGKDSGIIMQLFAFNVGLEVGQIIIVLATLIINLIALNVFKVEKRDWNLVISSIILGVALKIALENYIW